MQRMFALEQGGNTRKIKWLARARLRIGRRTARFTIPALTAPSATISSPTIARAGGTMAIALNANDAKTSKLDVWSGDFHHLERTKLSVASGRFRAAAAKVVSRNLTVTVRR